MTIDANEPMLPVDVLNEIRRQFDWRGPNGKPQGHIVITREQAEVLLCLPKLINAAIDKGFDHLSSSLENACKQDEGAR